MTLWGALVATAEFFSVKNPWVRELTVALVILLVGYLLSNILGRLVGRILFALNADRHIKTPYSATRAAASLTSGGGYLTTVALVLASLGLADEVGIVVAGLVLALFVLGMSRGLMDVPAHLLGRFRLAQGARLRDRIGIAGVQGTIARVGLFETQLGGADNERLVLPNALFWRQRFRLVEKRRR